MHFVTKAIQTGTGNSKQHRRMEWRRQDDYISNKNLMHNNWQTPSVSLRNSRELTFRRWGCCGLRERQKPNELDHSFLFCSCVYFRLYGPFNWISFHKFSRQLSTFSLCSSSLNSAVLVLSTKYLFTKVSLSPNIILWGWLGLKYYLTSYNSLSQNSLKRYDPFSLFMRKAVHHINATDTKQSLK